MATVNKSAPRRPWQGKVLERHERRDPAATAFYQSVGWRKDRKRHLAANPLCAECQRRGIVRAATVSDHIKPMSQGGAPWAWSNRQALCKGCHDSKSGTERHTSRR